MSGDEDEFDKQSQNPLSNTLRIDNELFKEEDDVVYDIVSVKRTSSTRHGENWDILVNGKSVLKLKGSRFTKKEKDYLRSPDGIQFVISGYKNGWGSINKFKTMMKEKNDNSKMD